jgi:hypothetical protein
MELALIIFVSGAFGILVALVKRFDLSSFRIFAIGYVFTLLCVLVSYVVSEKVVSLSVAMAIFLLIVLPSLLGGLLVLSKHEGN